jgi:hypothetical protein
MGSILLAKINLCSTMSVCALNNNSLRFDMELCEFFLLGGIAVVIVAWVDANLYLCVETGIDIVRLVEAIVC